MFGQIEMTGRLHLIAPNECWVILCLCENIFIIREACELSEPDRQISMLPIICRFHPPEYFRLLLKMLRWCLHPLVITSFAEIISLIGDDTDFSFYLRTVSTHFQPFRLGLPRKPIHEWYEYNDLWWFIIIMKSSSFNWRKFASCT